MSKQTEALKLALECIEAWDRGVNASDYWRDRFDAITAIREALAEQPAHSKPWVPLTEFDIDQIPYSCSHADSRLIAFAIEAKLREKNA